MKTGVICHDLVGFRAGLFNVIFLPKNNGIFYI